MPPADAPIPMTTILLLLLESEGGPPLWFTRPLSLSAMTVAPEIPVPGRISACTLAFHAGKRFASIYFGRVARFGHCDHVQSRNQARHQSLSLWARRGGQMPNRDILTIGTSAGGVEALLFLAGKMPRGLDAAIFITIHLSSQYRSDLDTILTRAGPLPVGFATDGEPIEKGRIYLAPPARHLLIE